MLFLPNSHHSDRIIIEDCGDIFRREFVGRIADKQACLANGTVTDDYTSGIISCQLWLGQDISGPR
jgi:hypothetical protein